MMLTRCPACTTTFRVTPEQVKVRHGKVRCGRCQHVFDAIEFLVDAAVAAPPPIAAAEVLPVEKAAPAAPPAIEVPPLAVATAARPAVEPIAAPAETVEAPAEPEAPMPEAPLPDEDTGEEPRPDEELARPPSPLSSTYAPTRKIRIPSWPWTVGVTLVLLALIAQIMLAYRVALAVKYPDLRPVLEMLCEQAQCIVELPSNSDLVSIEASDLHPGRKNGLELTATLRNRAPYAQAWPLLELTLTDGADKPIVRKVLTPEQYLPATQAEADGFPADGEFAVQLTFDTGNLPAAGYRLYLFYP
jgi:predicted Zn finger-like uncharacterized protein